MFPTQEPLVLCTPDGVEKGIMAPRHQVHRDGSWHISVNLALWVPGQGWLLQKRSAKKDTNPGAWEISASGHLKDNETPLQCALREASEELGVKITADQVKHFGFIPYESQTRVWWDREWQHCFWAIAPGNWKEYSFDLREVEALGCWQIAELPDDVRIDHPKLWALLEEIEVQISETAPAI